MNKKGFTLIEVLVSFTLVSVIAIFLFQIIYIVRDIYKEKSVKSELYIESYNLSNTINRDIITNDDLTKVEKTSGDNVNLTFGNKTISITIDRTNHTINYGNYSVNILSSATIGDITLDYDYVMAKSGKNGILKIIIPISHDGYNEDFNALIFARYDSTKTLITGWLDE